MDSSSSDLVAGKIRRRSTKHIDYLLRVEVPEDTQTVVMVLIETNAERLSSDHGLEHTQSLRRC